MTAEQLAAHHFHMAAWCGVQADDAYGPEEAAPWVRRQAEHAEAARYWAEVGAAAAALLTSDI